jgi:hypothetical protein
VTERATDQGAGLIAGYDAGAFFDEMIDASGAARPTIALCTTGSRR